MIDEGIETTNTHVNQSKREISFEKNINPSNYAVSYTTSAQYKHVPGGTFAAKISPNNARQAIHNYGQYTIGISFGSSQENKCSSPTSYMENLNDLLLSTDNTDITELMGVTPILNEPLADNAIAEIISDLNTTTNEAQGYGVNRRDLEIPAHVSTSRNAATYTDCNVTEKGIGAINMKNALQVMGIIFKKIS
ncbi:hypothetical protein DdX_21744 [Ditylenchus destructor]|uniref:Uncharacterized protein n=1 Tax=Ditylenchus destructor TaxID=166010 RepID=A0AAD4MEG5_9BILA|nr:hypothetical protein DdX_21744 [Ditylenchus destructor]